MDRSPVASARKGVASAPVGARGPHNTLMFLAVAIRSAGSKNCCSQLIASRCLRLSKFWRATQGGILPKFWAYFDVMVEVRDLFTKVSLLLSSLCRCFGWATRFIGLGSFILSISAVRLRSLAKIRLEHG